MRGRWGAAQVHPVELLLKAGPRGPISQFFLGQSHFHSVLSPGLSAPESGVVESTGSGARLPGVVLSSATCWLCGPGPAALLHCASVSTPRPRGVW